MIKHLMKIKCIFMLYVFHTYEITALGKEIKI